MTLQFTATQTILNGRAIVDDKNNKAQFALMLKAKLGLKG